MSGHRAPTPKAHLLFGHIPDYQRDTLDFERRAAREYGDVVRLRFFDREAYLISHPDDIHKVLVSEADKFYKAPIYRKLLSRFLGNGLLTSDGDFWRRQRKLAQPAFHHRRIQTYAQIMTDTTARMLATWQPGETRDINHDMMRLTLSIVVKALFNADIADSADTVGSALTVLLEMTNEAVQSPLGMYIPAWMPTEYNRKSKAAVAMLDAVVMGIVNERRASGEDTGDLISMLMMAEDDDGNRMSDQQLRDEAVTIVLAGHETTANALTWAWTLLSQHPDVEAKLHAEVDAALGGRVPALEDLRQLEYTGMVFKETMRLYPPLPSIGRQAMAEVELGGYRIRKGAIILISPHVVHHDARWFPEPEVFQPERMTRANEKALPKGAYIPFSTGPRVCIGNSFAEMEGALVLAMLAQQYRLRLAAGQTVTPEPVLTLRPKGAVLMRVEARERVMVAGESLAALT